MRPEYYADLYRHYATFVKAPEGAKPPAHRAAARNGSGLPWTEVLMREASEVHGRASACTTTRCPPASGT